LSHAIRKHDVRFVDHCFGAEGRESIVDSVWPVCGDVPHLPESLRLELFRSPRAIRDARRLWSNPFRRGYRTHGIEIAMGAAETRLGTVGVEEFARDVARDRR
jgi:hypothetical protein